VGWPAPRSGNALLVLDRNGNGEVDDLTELFGPKTTQRPSADPNGFLALRELDGLAQGGNGDGVVDERDRGFAKLRGWLDRDADGKVGPGELFPLRELGISALSTAYVTVPVFDSSQNLVKYYSRVWDLAGEPRQIAADVLFAVQPVVQR